MGNQLVRVVSEEWGHLPAGPYKILSRMAAYALDSSNDPAKPAGHYWKGWEDLAKALNRKLPDRHDNSPEAVTRRNTVRDEVTRHANTLVRLGAVERAVDNPGKGTRQVWKLRL